MNDLPSAVNVPVNDDAAKTLIDPLNAGALDGDAGAGDELLDLLLEEDEQPVRASAATAVTAMDMRISFTGEPR